MTMLFITGLVTLTATAQTNADDILGKWTNKDKTRVLEFVKSGNSYEAIIQEAPDKQLLGKKQLINLQYKSGTYQGSLYLPKHGKTLPCTIILNSNGTITLSAKSGFISQSQTWTKIK